MTPASLICTAIGLVTSGSGSSSLNNLEPASAIKSKKPINLLLCKNYNNTNLNNSGQLDKPNVAIVNTFKIYLNELQNQCYTILKFSRNQLCLSIHNLVY